MSAMWPDIPSERWRETRTFGNAAGPRHERPEAASWRRSEADMRIGIISAGNIGSTLTRRLTALGHDVAVANSRGPETLADLAAETGATAGEESSS